jgi:hypothetical protein
MKPFVRVLAVAAFAAAVAVATPVLGLEATGQVMNVDVTAGTITIANGQTFKVSDAEMFKAIKLGDLVLIEYTSDANGLLVATSIKIAT